MPDRAPTPTRLTAESSAETTTPLFQATANKQSSIDEIARVAPLPLPPPVGIDLSSDKERLESAPYCVTTNIRNAPVGIEHDPQNPHLTSPVK